MGGWEALIAGVIGAASAYSSSKAAKKQSESVHDNWERRMAYEEEKVRRKQNSMGAKAAPYLMEQMLRVYGQQSAGRGGFTLPIDEMLQSMNIKGREDGSYSSSSGGSYDGGYGNDTPQGRASAFSAKKTNDGRKSGSFRVVAGNVDPEVDGYNGKTMNSGLEQANQLDNFGSAFGTPASAVGGARESTRGMGNTTTQTERGYTTVQKPLGNGSVMTPTERLPNIEGELATGGTGLFDSKDIDPAKFKALQGMLGLGTGTAPNPDGTFGDGKFQRSDIMNWARAHPVVWKILAGLGGTVAPGLPQIVTAGLNIADSRQAKKAKASAGQDSYIPYTPFG